MTQRPTLVNDRDAVQREYATEERFLARRLSAQARLEGPLVEDAMMSAILEAPAGRVLEVGCGTGDISARVHREASADLIAIDLSRRMAELTHARGLVALRSDIEALPFPDVTFGCVLANRVLYHVPDLDAGLREIKRVLSSGGFLLAVTYSIDHLRELSDLIGAPAISTSFNAENGAATLDRYFARVERRDFEGKAVFDAVDSVRHLLAAYGDFLEKGDRIDLDAVTLPFIATYRHTLFIAHKD